MLPMQIVKIQIPDREECARGFAAFIPRFRVDCFRDNVVIVPEPALKVLQDLQVRYVECGRGGLRLHTPGSFGEEKPTQAVIVVSRR
jgi:hypothetical protein